MKRYLLMEIAPLVNSGSNTFEKAVTQTWFFVKFLQENKLASRVIARSPAEIGMDFILYEDDLTDDGLKVFDTGYQNYLRRFERNPDADPSDVRVLERALKKIRAEKK